MIKFQILFFTAEKHEKDDIALFKGNPILNVNPPVEHVKKTNDFSTNIYNNINFVIMAEGYRADQISFFLEYANEAAKKPAYFSFNTNDWKNVNVFTFKTISPESFNLSSGKNDIFSFFDYDPANGTINTNTIKRVIDNTNSLQRTNLTTSNIDAYIIFVNNGNYDQPLDPSYKIAKMEYKNNKPVYCLIINTQFNRYINDNDFLDYVHIDKIGELLN